MLSDLLRNVSDEPSGPTGLGGLVRGAERPAMSLPEAMNALERGEIPRPPDGFAELADQSELPPKPTPAPPRYPEQDFIDEARQQAKTDREEMRVCVARKRAEADAARARRLDEAERQLMEIKNNG